VVDRIFKANAAPVASAWMWTLAFGHHEDRPPTHGYAESREGAMAVFAKSVTAGIKPCGTNKAGGSGCFQTAAMVSGLTTNKSQSRRLPPMKQP
jgi:hypothetical protein